MKKFYFLGLALAGFVFSNAQFVEDFEGYEDGEEVVSIDPWTTWSGGVAGEGIIVTSAQANDGFLSGMIGGGGIQDAILKLGNKTSGVWTVKQMLYIPSGSSGYFNFQEDQDLVSSGGVWGIEFFFSYSDAENGFPGPGLLSSEGAGGTMTSFDFPFDEWFEITAVTDVSGGATGTVKISVNGLEVYNGEAYLESRTLGAIDYFSADASNMLFVDSIEFVEGDLSTNDVSVTSSISVYPTVANEVINVSAKSNISEITVFNTAGQQVAKVAGNGTSAQVNVSTLPAGVYVVKTVAGKEIKTTKVVVK